MGKLRMSGMTPGVLNRLDRAFSPIVLITGMYTMSFHACTCSSS